MNNSIINTVNENGDLHTDLENQQTVVDFLNSIENNLATKRQPANSYIDTLENINIQHYQNQINELRKNLDTKSQLISHLENERLESDFIIQDKDWYINNLEKHNNQLQNELANQHIYIQYVNKVNTQLSRVLARFGNELKSFQIARTTRLIKSLRNRNLKEIFISFLKSPIEGSLDSPRDCELTFGTLVISGWATSKAGSISKIEAFLNEIKIGEILYGTARPDVLATLSSQNKIDCGFASTLNFDPKLLECGVKTLKIRVTDSKGNYKDFTRLLILEKDQVLSALGNFAAEINSHLLGEKTSEFQQHLYSTWITKNEPNLAELIVQRKNSALWNYRPLISVIMPVYNTPASLLKTAINSVINQNYENWELCIVDGASNNLEIKTILTEYAKRNLRIRVKFLDTNLGVTGNSNEAINMAKGEFIALFDHNDKLAPNALYENALLLNQHPKADMIYSDEDKFDVQGRRCDPHFKPDWSPDFFCSTMYTCHLGVYRRSLINKIGGFRSGFEGAQDYDLVLRLIEQTNQIFHIPKVLYHWRKTENSIALSLADKDYAQNAQIKAVSEHFQRINVEAEVTSGLADNLLRVKRKLSTQPKVSIIIPTRDRVELLKTCINSICKLSTYSNYEIIIVDNNSSEPETLKYFEEISKEHDIRLLEYAQPFNFAGINNFAANNAQGELLLFLNNDTKVISPEWLEAMIEQAVRPEVGAVGARLLYSNGLVQHAGVIVGIGGVAGHSHKHFSNNHPGYFNRSKAIQNFSAVTGACMMVRKEFFISLGGFDEKNLAIAYNDLDFCLRVRQKNLLIVYTPYAELYHYESLTRGSDQTLENTRRFQREAEYILDYWKEKLKSDPYYNPNLTLEKEDFSIAKIA